MLEVDRRALMPAGRPMIDVEDLSLTYDGPTGPVAALAGVSLQLAPGQSCAVIGPSGCGKSTLLYVLAGLLPAAAGMVTVAGEPVAPRRPGTALVLQDFGLLPWKTVWHNAALGLEVRRLPRAEQASRVEQALRRVGLWEARHRFPAQLSGGQRQRVAIARSLCLRPDLLLMDEPFSALDALTREDLQDLLLQTWQGSETTLVLVTHSIEEAVFLGQRVLVMTPHPGRVAADIANPAAGVPSYRRQPEFHAQCTRVRDALERGVAG
ncbi:MAG: ABC transporter ATP-binding protein [Symbiobacteriia bacterium]